MDLARQIADERVRPVAAHYDEANEFPWEMMKLFAQSDLFGVFVPEAYGGMPGSGCLPMVLVTEELSKACAGIALGFAASALGTYPIILYGTEEQKKKYLPDIASGKKIGAFHQRSVSGMAWAFHHRIQVLRPGSPMSLGSADANARSSGRP